MLLDTVSEALRADLGEIEWVWQELIVRALILRTIHHTHASITDNRRLSVILRRLSKSLPYVIQPVEVRLKDVNYIARRKKAVGLADTSQPTTGSMVLLCIASLYHL